ncbi:endonuclease domain-containing protein [Vibrio pomeroyi]|uniref:Endonuclease domain-containing protein n=1 Tax=Vibrio pomeroyi TaxID=198832 RepID=A0ABV4MYU5_9VIBR
MKIYTQPQLNTFRKILRSNMPQPERKLWFYIRRKQLGVKFRRQHSIGKYIVDFFCCELKLAIEIDGNSHFSEQAQAYDHQRTLDLNKLGIKMLRFTNNEVNQNLEEVLVKIINSIPK